MGNFIENYYNYVLYSAIISWCSAQVIKTIINMLSNKQFNPERLVGAGGMPSSHSAFVTSATVAVSRSSGVKSTEFAIIFILAIVVMYDAMGVRRAAGKHAHEINKWNRFIDEQISLKQESGDDLTENEKKTSKAKELQEYLGHTPFEVLGGVLLGIIVAMLVPIL